MKFVVATVTISCVVGLLLAEVIVRLAYTYYSPDTVRMHAIPFEKRVYGAYVMAGADRLIDLDSGKAWGTKAADEPSDLSIFISKNGYRGPGFAVRKPAGVYRIIVVGGSAVFDLNTSDSPSDYKNGWPHRVGVLLAAQGFDHVEVINAGVPGQTSADSLGRVYTQLWTYEPDMIVVYHGWNDFKFWHRIEVTPETPLIDLVLPFNPKDDPFQHYQGAMDRLLSYSQLYVRLRTRYYRWRWQPNYEGAVPKDIQMANEYGEYGPHQHRLNLTLIVQAAHAIGARPVLVKQATLVTSDNSREDRKRIGYQYQSLEHSAIERAFQHSYRIIDRVGAEAGALVVDPTEVMNGRSELFADHVHTTPAGSEELASIVAAALTAVEAPFEAPTQPRIRQHPTRHRGKAPAADGTGQGSL